MRKYIRILYLSVATIVLCASCLSSTETELDKYNDTAITVFQLSTVNRYVYTVSKSGADSVYKTTLTNPTVFTIDQYQHRIYNNDSLPYDIDAAHILANITAKNNGIVVLKNVDSDTLKYFSSTDSIDFTQPREIRVYAYDGTDLHRSYTVQVNVHKVASGQLHWEEMDMGGLPEDPLETQWKNAAEAAGMNRFIGYGSAEGYAFDSEGTLMVSRDLGSTWAADYLDDNAADLPIDNVAFTSWSFEENDSTDYQMMVGTRDDSETCCVWRKVAEYSHGSEAGKWIFIPVASYNRHRLPKMDGLSMVYYNKRVLVLGNDGEIYVSRDLGISWRTDTDYELPEGVGERSSLQLKNYGDGYIWLIDKDTDEVWRGQYLE